MYVLLNVVFALLVWFGVVGIAVQLYAWSPNTALGVAGDFVPYVFGMGVLVRPFVLWLRHDPGWDQGGFRRIAVCAAVAVAAAKFAWIPVVDAIAPPLVRGLGIYAGLGAAMGAGGALVGLAVEAVDRFWRRQGTGRVGVHEQHDLPLLDRMSKIMPQLPHPCAEPQLIDPAEIAGLCGLSQAQVVKTLAEVSQQSARVRYDANRRAYVVPPRPDGRSRRG